MADCLTTNQIVALRKLVRRLDQHGIDFVVIGGLAATAWGVKRNLVDIDIQISAADFKKVEDIFIGDITTRTRHYQTENWDICQMIAQLNGVSIDICQAENFYVKKNGRKYSIPSSINKAPIKKIAGVSLPVLPLGELIKYKQLIARPVDIADLSLLIQLQ